MGLTWELFQVRTMDPAETLHTCSSHPTYLPPKGNFLQTRFSKFYGVLKFPKSANPQTSNWDIFEFSRQTWFSMFWQERPFNSDHFSSKMCPCIFNRLTCRGHPSLIKIHVDAMLTPYLKLCLCNSSG